MGSNQPSILVKINGKTAIFTPGEGVFLKRQAMKLKAVAFAVLGDGDIAQLSL